MQYHRTVQCLFWYSTVRYSTGWKHQKCTKCTYPENNTSNIFVVLKQYHTYVHSTFIKRISSYRIFQTVCCNKDIKNEEKSIKSQYRNLDVSSYSKIFSIFMHIKVWKTFLLITRQKFTSNTSMNCGYSTHRSKLYSTCNTYVCIF